MVSVVSLWPMATPDERLVRMKVVGLMSGTSGDGVDAALVEIHGQGHKVRVKTLDFRSLPYPPELRSRILTDPSLRSVI